MGDDIQAKLNRELKRLQEEDLPELPIETITEIIGMFKRIDKDMSPIHDLLLYSIDNIDNESARNVIFYRFLKFYGILGSTDILKIRQKYIILKGTKELQKVPFLKEKDKECINILLKEHGII